MIESLLLDIGPALAPAEAHSGIRQRVHRAIRTCQLVRPGRCSTCGRLQIGIQGHHEDYDQPLHVEWLCQDCHRARHLSLAPACALGSSEGVSYVDPHPTAIQLDLVAILYLQTWRYEQLEIAA